MRSLTVACAAFCLATTAAATTAQAGEIKIGRDLVEVCRQYMTANGAQDNNALRTLHPCRNFLQGFFVSLIARENARTDAMLKGLAYASKDACVRMPDFLSYREMAGRLVNYAQSNTPALAGPASTLAQKTLERDFPCPKQTTPR